MRRHETLDYLNIKTGAAALLILFIIIIFIIWKPFATNESEVQEKLNETNLTVDLSEDGIKVLNSNIYSKKFGKDDLCESYIFGDGDTLNILDHEIIVEAIGANSIKVLVDDERKILTEEENEYFDSGIKLGIKQGGIFYYSVGSEHNVVEMMVGCDYDDNPNDKYIQSKAESYCRRSYDDCLIIFGIED